MVTMRELAFSSEKCSPIHLSRPVGSSAGWEPSSDSSAERISARTPLTMEPQNTNTPRMKGRAFQPVRFFTGSVSTLRSPSALRTTTQRFSGPCMRMPSMRACPPQVVLNFVSQL